MLGALPVWDLIAAGLGTTYESPAIQVNSGDTILGTIQSTCSPGTLTCSFWNINTEDVTSGRSTLASQKSNNTLTFNWAFAGVLEVYNLAQCTDYPPSWSTTFYNVALYDDNFNRISNPGWILNDAGSAGSPGLTPQCNYGGQETATQVTLDYGPPPAATPYVTDVNVTVTGGPPFIIYYSGVLEDSTPGATIYVDQVWLCGQPEGGPSGAAPLYLFYSVEGCSGVSGSMHATAPGYSQSGEGYFNL